jgi:hypothetical protein
MARRAKASASEQEAVWHSTLRVHGARRERRIETMRALLIRTVFDQYSHIENRLTHGLIQVLARDQRLARHFTRSCAGVRRAGLG